MSKLQEFESRIYTLVKEEGLQGISGSRFVDITRKDIRTGEDVILKANATPKQYCEMLATMHNRTVEEMAEELLDLFDNLNDPTKSCLVTGECVICSKFLFGGKACIDCGGV